MFEDLEQDSGFDAQSVKQPAQAQTQQRPSYGQSNSGYGNKQPYQAKDDPVQDPYIAVGMFTEKDFPEEVKTQFYNLASKLIARGITVRINADDKAFIERLRALSNDKVEVYLPWRGFNEIESKKTFNTNTAKDVASKHFSGWEKIPDSVKAILASQVRLVFGDRNNSTILCLVTWSKDGASKGSEVSKDTGRVGFIIKVASHYSFPVLNLSRQNAISIMEKNFNL